MLGHNVEVKTESGTVLYGTLQKLDHLGAVIYEHKDSNNVFIPIHRIIRITDKGQTPR